MIKIQYKLNYSDKSNIQQLEIEIINEFEFINDSYSTEDSEAKEIYLLLISDNREDIQDYLLELTQGEN